MTRRSFLRDGSAGARPFFGRPRARARGSEAPELAGEPAEQTTTAALPQSSAAHERINRGLLAGPERRALLWLAERTPAAVEPDHLTAVGVGGAVLVLIGFLCTNASSWFFAVVILGLALNWFGDSLDGTLARYRRIERPEFGYFMDHSCDLISQTCIFVGLGLSPYFTILSALMALSMYLLMSSYTYLKVMILRTHQLAYGGMGATELRVAIGGWGLLAMWIGPDLISARAFHHIMFDEIVGAAWVVVFLGFVMMVRADLAALRRRLDVQDEPWREASHIGSSLNRRLR